MPWTDCLVDAIRETKNADGSVTREVVGKVPTINCLPILFQNIISAALLFVGVVAVFLIIYSGLKFISSGGDAKQTEEAQKTLTYAILGLILVLLSFFIINLIADITGAQCIKLFGFTNC